MKTGKQLAAEAIETTDRHRGMYGDQKVFFERIAIGWQQILQCGITAGQVTLCMDWLKTCRLISQPDHADSLVDKIGYAICYADVCEGKPDAPAAPTNPADPADLDAPLPDYMTFRECEGCRWPVDCRTKGACRNFAAVEAIHAAE